MKCELEKLWRTVNQNAAALYKGIPMPFKVVDSTSLRSREQKLAAAHTDYG
jgi:hypothetical protein